MPKRKAKPLTLKGEKKRIDSSRQKRRLNPEYLHNESERDKSAQQKRREDPEYLAHQLSRDNSTRRSRHFFYGLFSAFGISAGAHRLWSHRSYKANFKLQVLLMIMQTICIENDVIEWVRDHRVHHKFSDTDADPHNSQRGLFFSHMGWLLCKKHPDVRKYGSKVDMSDIESEPVLKFQRKFYIPLVLIFSFIIPIKISMYLVGHDLMVGICAIFCRYVISLHLVWFTNSFAHVGSWKPYDKNIAPSDSKFFGIICFGEGWHNFHHVFPWDYKVSELPLYRYNFTIAFIDFFSWLGWATDLKIASDDMIKARVLRTGDGSHPYSMKSTRKVKKLDENCNIVEFMKSDESYWGLGDTDIPEEDLKVIYTLNTH